MAADSRPLSRTRAHRVPSGICSFLHAQHVILKHPHRERGGRIRRVSYVLSLRSRRVLRAPLPLGGMEGIKKPHLGGRNISLASHWGLVLYYLWQMWITDRHTKSPQVRTLGAFLFPYCRQGLTPRLVAVVSLIEPFADAVGDYTSQDGENKCGHRHSTHPLSLPCVGAATNPI